MIVYLLYSSVLYIFLLFYIDHLLCWSHLYFLTAKIKGGGGILVKSSVLNFRLLATFFLNIQPRFHSINKLDIFFTTFFFFMVFQMFLSAYLSVAKTIEDKVLTWLSLFWRASLTTGQRKPGLRTSSQTQTDQWRVRCQQKSSFPK